MSGGESVLSWEIQTNSAGTQVIEMGKIFSSESLGVMARGLILCISLDFRPIYYKFRTQQYYIRALPNILEIDAIKQ